MITHIVLFKLADPSPANLGQTRQMLESMVGRVPQLRHLETGVDLVRAERSYDLALLTKFDSLADLQAYQVDPYHAGTVVPHMKAVCTAIVAVDYES